MNDSLSEVNDEMNDSLSKEDIHDINIMRGIIGFVTMTLVIISLISVFLFVRYKKNYLPKITVTERLLLYMGFATIFRSFVVILQMTTIDYNNANKAQTRLCAGVGFLNQWSTWTEILTIQMLIVHLLIQLSCGIEVSKNRLLEVFYIIVPIFFPLLFSWVPFIYESYGIAGAWCWIQMDKQHMKQGFYLQIGLWLGPLPLIQLLDMIAMFIIYPILFRCKRKMNVFDKNDGQYLLKQHVPFMLLISLSIIFEWVTFANRLYVGVTGSSDFIGIWYIHAMTTSCAGILIAVCIWLYLLVLTCQQPHQRFNEMSQTIIEYSTTLESIKYHPLPNSNQ